MTENNIIETPSIGYTFDNETQRWQPDSSAFRAEPVIIDHGAQWHGEAEGTTDPNFRRFTVTMSLQLTAGSVEEASDRAMAWRDAVDTQHDLGFDWHLHHPLGC